MRFKLRSTVLPAVAFVVVAACSADANPARGPVTWTGARALTETEDTPRGVVTDGAQVLFTTGRYQVGENAIRAVAIDGATTSHIISKAPGGQIPNGGLALDANAVYVAAGTGILRLPIAGGDATTVVQGRPATIASVVVTGDTLWWTTWQWEGPQHVELARMPKAGGPVEVVGVNIAGGLGRPYPDGDGALVASPIGVLKVRPGSQVEVVASAKAVGGPVSRLAVDDQRIYLTVAGADRLLAIPRRGGAPVTLARDVDTEGDIAVVDGDVLFFRQPGLGSRRPDMLMAVPATGGAERTIASGLGADGDVAVVGTDRVVFSADWRVWVASVRP